MISTNALDPVPGALTPDAVPQRAQVLLVDDRPEKLLALGAVLEGLDFDLLTAQSGKEALRLVLANEFAVILLDVSMPIMDGFETAGLIHQRKTSEHIPIIFITAHNHAETHASHGYSLGAVDYIYAPVVREVLRAKVSVFTDLYRKNQIAERQGELLRLAIEQRAVSLEGRLDRLLNRLNVGVFRLTRDGLLISGNPCFFRIFGMDPGTLPATVDFSQRYLVSTDRLALIARLEAEGQVQEYHVRQRRIDGSIIWVSISETLVTDHDGVVRIDGLIEDITVRKDVEMALIAKAEELARSNAELAEFAYVASHDLQEPLRMMSSFASLLAERYTYLFDEKNLSHLNYIVSGAKRMRDLIGDILEYSKIGKLPTQVPVDCNEVLAKALFNLQEIIAVCGARITNDHLPTVTGDPVLLGQVFQNLIGNAIKFHHAERIPVVHVGVERRDAFWSFAVSDNGIGIEPRHLELIFNVFQRVHRRDEYDGTGIGLAICRKAVQQHGGTITVTSQPGLGSVFRFMLAGNE